VGRLKEGAAEAADEGPRLESLGGWEELAILDAISRGFCDDYEERSAYCPKR
jgi:hypothetical protein